MKKTVSESILAIEHSLADNVHLLRVIRIRLSEHERVTAMIEETITSIEGISERWKRYRDHELSE